MEAIKNLLETILFILSTLNPIYHLIKEFNIMENIDEILIQAITTGGPFTIICLLALINKIKK